MGGPRSSRPVPTVGGWTVDAWTILKGKHKLGRLNTPTVERILANPDTPPSVRALVQQYIAERLDTFPRSLENVDK